eukprot:TRINITY_DN13928_c0_g1_i1.p1 TRINITY_DN13928_c0_g1~~TRINITY_DN13928_c0_g1_i1.p1  ORF type:complete len:898 (-),score=147.08 TRINITY_DN13928_c0_g1_i1:23-2716(-)
MLSGGNLRTTQGSQPGSSAWKLEVVIGEAFEECLEFSWQVHRNASDAAAPSISTLPKLKKSVVELVLNIQKAGEPKQTEPTKDATRKTVEFTSETSACLQNMPEGRKFFIAVTGTFADGSQVRSPWTDAKTLHPNGREEHLANLDPLDRPRLNCRSCPCMGYVAVRWSQFTFGSNLRCRRCGCTCEQHVAVEVADIFWQREANFHKRFEHKTVTPLPRDAIRWDERECDLWFHTSGAFHPRRTVGEGRTMPGDDAKIGPGGPFGTAGKQGRVSVVSPTTDRRHQFHEHLWRCFEAQEWKDKELVVVETYTSQSSPFFEQLARKDCRVTYVKFQVPAGKDWSIGLKRNIGAHLASGEYIANFDDDDIYAPTYLLTMVDQLKLRKAFAITLSSWYILDIATSQWSFCDTIAWGLAQGKDETAQEVKSWAYGYGFSYVNLRRASLEVPYDDRNMGEDYDFITKLQTTKTKNRVQLLHDDFGICVHVQHGGNTSNTFPIRQVTLDEAAYLDVANLAKMVDTNLRATILDKERDVHVHTSSGLYKVTCRRGMRIDEFLKRLENLLGRPCADMKVHLVPPPGRVSQVEREVVAAKVLGVEVFMENLATSKPELHGEAVAAERRRLMLGRVKGALRAEDRIPLMATNLWVASPEDAEAEKKSVKALQLDEGLQGVGDEVFIAELTVQATNSKNFFRDRTVQVLLPARADVKTLREYCGQAMPRTARLLAADCEPGCERSLKDSDKVPPKLVVTEFLGRCTFFTLFSQAQCSKNLSMLKAFFLRAEAQRQMDAFDKEAAGNDKAYRMKLSELLMTEAYPAVFRHYDVEIEGPNSLMALTSGMHRVTESAELRLQQLEVEALMRNKGTVFELVHNGGLSEMGWPKQQILNWIEGAGPPLRQGFTRF